MALHAAVKPRRNKLPLIVAAVTLVLALMVVLVAVSPSLPLAGSAALLLLGLMLASTFFFAAASLSTFRQNLEDALFARRCKHVAR